MALVNLDLIKHPTNWIVVIAMIGLGAILISLVEIGLNQGNLGLFHWGQQ